MVNFKWWNILETFMHMKRLIIILTCKLLNLHLNALPWPLSFLPNCCRSPWTLHTWGHGWSKGSRSRERGQGSRWSASLHGLLSVTYTGWDSRCSLLHTIINTCNKYKIIAVFKTSWQGPRNFKLFSRHSIMGRNKNI